MNPKKNENPIQSISNFIFIESRPQKADLIFIPGSDEADLMHQALRLIREGCASRILVSGGENPQIPNFPSEAAFLKNIAVTQGLSEELIMDESKAKNTFENAKFTKEIIEQLNLKLQSVLLISKAFHARRALMTYQRYFPDTEIFSVSVPGKHNITRENWFHEEAKISIVMGEVVKIGSYFQTEIPFFRSTMG